MSDHARRVEALAAARRELLRQGAGRIIVHAAGCVDPECWGPGCPCQPVVLSYQQVVDLTPEQLDARLREDG